MDIIELKEQIIYQLSTLPVYLPSSTGVQHVVRCPYCGDSNNPSHGHFSIKIDRSDNSEMLYRCLKCGASGLFGSDIMDDLGLNVDADLHSTLNRFTRNVITKSRNYSGKVNSYIIPPVIDNYVYRSKLDYINNRLGINLTYDDAPKYKIILSIRSFLIINDLHELPGLNNHQIDILERYYVGFLSKNNNTITFRNIGNIGKRYLKYKIMVNNMNPDNFYNIPKSTEFMYTNDIDINIAEGIFDILSVKYNVREDFNDEAYYFAICGYGYGAILRFLIYSGFTTGLNVHIYSDKDKSDDGYVKDVVNNPRIRPWINSLSIHRNFYPGEKDFGVPKDKINEKIRMIYTATT